MSCNDPHLEAQIELEARHPQEQETPPPGFARTQARVLLSIAAIVVVIWLIFVAIR